MEHPRASHDERGMHEEALTAYRKAVERAPESADAHYNLGVTAQKYGLLPEAREHLALYLALKPRDLEARYRLAAVQAETGMLPDAVKIFGSFSMKIRSTRMPRSIWRGL